MNKNDVTVVIQASQIGESIPNRLQRKVDDTEDVVSYLIRRLKHEGFTKIIMATTNRPEDDILAQACADNEIGVYRGDYYDIPNRLLNAAKTVNAHDIVRVLGINPLVDTDSMLELYETHVGGKYDYSYNEHIQGVLWGMGCDVFNVGFLDKLCKMDLTDSQKGTINVFIRQNESQFNVFKYGYCEKRPGFKLNLESEKDLEVISEVAMNVTEVSCSSVTEYMKKHRVTAWHNLDAPPKEAGIEKLFLNPEKTKSILEKNITDATYPISVEMTLTNACNMNCVYCSDAMLRSRQGVTEQIGLEDFKRLFDDLSTGGTKGIVIEGGGEPTLYSHFDEVVHYAKSAGLAVGLITNGSKRLDEDVVKEFEWIRVSLDASTPEEYKKLKGVDYYEKVIDNIAYYAKHCNTVGVGYVVTKENVSCIEALVMRLRELKASYIQLRPVVDCEELYPYGIDLSYLKIYMTNSFGVQVDGMVENAYSGNHGLPCYASSITSIISGDGSVYICGRLNIYPWLKPIGNIKKQSFYEIWNGEERKKQTEMIYDASFCKQNCPQCRISKFNALFEKLYAVKTMHFI